MKDSSDLIHRSASRGILAVFLAAAFVFAIAASVAAQEPAGDKAGAAIELFQKGQDAHEKGELAAAVELYGKAIAIVPEFPEAEMQRGSALLSLGRTDDAEKAFRRAVELRGEWTLALANLGSVLVGKGQFTEAEKLLAKAVSLDDTNTLAYSALTELRLRTNAKPEILRDLLTRIAALTSKAKSTASIWAARGALENAVGDKKSARLSFDQALELDPKNRFALAAKAGAALDEGDTAAAESVVKKLEAATPGSADAKVIRARLLLSAGKSDEAVAMLNSIQGPAADVIALRDKIVVNSSEDVVELENRLKTNTTDAFILGRLCTVLRTSDPAKALDYCRRAAEADPSDINHAIGYGAALVRANMYAEAVDLLRKLETMSPDNVTVRANLATALFQLKRYAEAQTEYQWISEKQPSSPIAFYFLGITHDHLAEYKDAMANYQQFLRLADAEKNKLEIEKVNLRLPDLQKLIKDGKGKRT